MLNALLPIIPRIANVKLDLRVIHLTVVIQFQWPPSKKNDTLAIHHLAELTPNVGNVTELDLVYAFPNTLGILTLGADRNVLRIQTVQETKLV